MPLPNVLRTLSVFLFPVVLDELAEFIAIGCDQLLFQLRGFEFDCDVVAVRGDQSVAALEACDIGDLGVGELERVLYTNGLIVLKVQNDLGLGIIDDTLAVLAVVKGEEVVQVLGRRDRSAAIATDDFEDLQAKLSGHGIAPGTNQLPDLIDKDSVLLSVSRFS